MSKSRGFFYAYPKKFLDIFSLIYYNIRYKEKFMAETIPSIHSTTPVTHTLRDVITKVYQGDVPGETKVVSTFYNVTIYDYMGKLQTVTNSHVIDYLI